MVCHSPSSNDEGPGEVVIVTGLTDMLVRVIVVFVDQDVELPTVCNVLVEAGGVVGNEEVCGRTVSMVMI